MPNQRGPAADPRFLPTTDTSNPYGFTANLLVAGILPPRITKTHVFFFGHEGPWPETCLSQWFAAPFTGSRNAHAGLGSADSGEVEFPTMEHYMMFHKALLMGDTKAAERIINEPHPSTAKKLGREVKSFNRDIWNQHADAIVEEGNWFKFLQNHDLAEVLLGTGTRVLVEASPDDRIWGIGFNANDAEGNESNWGENRVGKALMKVRDRLEEHHKILSRD